MIIIIHLAEHPRGAFDYITASAVPATAIHAFAATSMFKPVATATFPRTLSTFQVAAPSNLGAIFAFAKVHLVVLRARTQWASSHHLDCGQDGDAPNEK